MGFGLLLLMVVFAIPGLLSTWHSEGMIELLGQKHDVISLFAKFAFMVLPSYMEGLPKMLIGASAGGRAIPTKDVPGCRDAVIKDKTGILVPPRGVVAFADAIQHLLEDLVSAHMEIYRNLRGILA